MILSLALLGGCLDLEELLAGVTADTYAQATVIGVSAPEGMDLTDSVYDEGARAGVYLATLSGEPVEAELQLSSAHGDVALEDQGDGTWVTPALQYTAGATYSLQRDGSEILRAEAAPAASVTLDAERTVGAPLIIDLNGQDFERALVTILNLDTGEEVWDNLPEDISAALLEIAETDPLLVEVPGDVFSEAGAYAVGVAGLRPSTPADVTDLNTVASLMATGVMVLQPVQVTD